MTHIGFICPPISGHLNPMTVLGKELQERGHRVTFFHVPDIESKVLAAGLEFWPIGQSDYPPGAMNEYFAQLSQLRGLTELRFTISCGQRLAAMVCRELPAALKQAGVEILLADQNEPAGGTVAESLGIPFVTVCSAVAINREAAIPPVFTSWKYSDSWWAYLRNRAGYYLFERTIQPINGVLNDYRRQCKLPVIRYADDTFSQLAQISQQTADLDFPRKALPAYFHYTGPFLNRSLQINSVPEQRENKQPLISASLGTLHNCKPELFYSIAAACAELGVQLVISLGGGSKVTDYQQLPGSPKVLASLPRVEFVELLAKSDLVITHAGFNTVLETLSNGRPMVALPMTMDQPGFGARLSWAGVSEIVPLERLSVPKLRAAIQRVLMEDSYRRNALRIRESIRQAGGLVRAADIVEQVIATGKPVLSGQGDPALQR